MISWHRLFGITLMDLFHKSNYEVELEKDLSHRKQLLDVVIIRKKNNKIIKNLPDGFENLRSHNLITFKSFQEPLSAWSIKELCSHYVNYRKQVSNPKTKLINERSFQLFAISARFPKKLSKQIKFRPLKQGAYETLWGLDKIKIIVLNEIEREKKNAIWHLFAGRKKQVRFGFEKYEYKNKELSTLNSKLITQYLLEVSKMPYTINDYKRDFAREITKYLTLSELEAIVEEQKKSKLSPREKAQALSKTMKKYLNKALSMTSKDS
jgi:hypothetical protein